MKPESYFHDRVLDKLVLWTIPRWIVPNYITWLRIILIPFVFYVNYRQWYGLGIPLFLFAAFTDAIDGSLARTRGQITDFGKVFDPIADKLLIGSMVVLLVFRYLPPYVGFSVIGLEALFILFGFIFHVQGNVRQANVWGKIKMLLQCIAVCVILLGLTLKVSLLFAFASWIFGVSLVFAVISLFFHGI